MARQITFSVIIPTYNREVYLLDAVLSAVNASPENTEIIIVNDGRQLSEATRNRLGALNAGLHYRTLHQSQAVGEAHY